MAFSQVAGSNPAQFILTGITPLPYFSGITESKPNTDNSVKLTWLPISEISATGKKQATNPNNLIIYEIYVGQTPHFVPNNDSLQATVSGATEYELTGLVPGITNYILIIAIDNQGHRSLERDYHAILIPAAGYASTPKPNSIVNFHNSYQNQSVKRKIQIMETEQDIKTYYFDEEIGRWIVLERVTLDTEKQEIVSHTDHFTDMINAVVTVPESPQSVSFNPTQIKDIKAADPGAGINLIEVPQANNMGDMRLSYPIEIPPGRVGMQPQLGVSYSSAGGNGWMGLNWSLSIPSVDIHTGWGVPRYSASLETETYTLSGGMLTPVAHRDELKSRTPEKIFHSRVEGAFQKNIRHGNNPQNYWWEVTDKNGSKSFYGGDPENGLVANMVLIEYNEQCLMGVV